jgi:hypothetical protein
MTRLHALLLPVERAERRTIRAKWISLLIAILLPLLLLLRSWLLNSNDQPNISIH